MCKARGLYTLIRFRPLQNNDLTWSMYCTVCHGEREQVRVILKLKPWPCDPEDKSSNSWMLGFDSIRGLRLCGCSTLELNICLTFLFIVSEDSTQTCCEIRGNQTHFTLWICQKRWWKGKVTVNPNWIRQTLFAWFISHSTNTWGFQFHFDSNGRKWLITNCWRSLVRCMSGRIAWRSLVT